MAKKTADAAPAATTADPPVESTPPPIPGLTEGRVVHFNDGGKARAAIVAEVLDATNGWCWLAVFEPGHREVRPVRCFMGDEPGAWNWPPRA